LPRLNDAEHHRSTNALEQDVPEDLGFIETSANRMDYFRIHCSNYSAWGGAN
jgi:hypothetical protein